MELSRKVWQKSGNRKKSLAGNGVTKSKKAMMSLLIMKGKPSKRIIASMPLKMLDIMTMQNKSAKIEVNASTVK